MSNDLTVIAILAVIAVVFIPAAIYSKRYRR
jgi:hypothetical protein